MCGIWGVFPFNGKLDNKDLNLVDQIMTLTSLRGKDSTGVAVIGHGQAKPRTIKMVGGPDYLLNSDAYRKVEEFAVKKGIGMFGHGRFSTKGAVIAKNAHPHTVDHITLVHNGTIHFGLEEDHKEVTSDNDSLALCNAIAKEGLVEALYKVSGAYALIIHDSKKNCVYFVRNDERPLHQVEFQGRRVVMSEDTTLAYLAKRNSYPSYEPKITYFAKNIIYELDMATGKFSQYNDLVEKLAKKFQVPAITHGAGKTGTNKGTTTQYFAQSIRLLCVTIEKAGDNSNMWRYIFLDEDNNEIVALSANHLPDKLGMVALTRKIGVLREAKAAADVKFVTFRELEWEDEKPTEKEDQQDKLVPFRNGVKLKQSEIAKLIKKEDCCLCSGVIGENEIPDTILTSNHQMICTDCIKQGRHFAFGFGQ